MQTLTKVYCLCFSEAENILFAKESMLRQQRQAYIDDYDKYTQIVNIQLGLRDNIINQLMTVILGSTGESTLWGLILIVLWIVSVNISWWICIDINYQRIKPTIDSLTGPDKPDNEVLASLQQKFLTAVDETYQNQLKKQKEWIKQAIDENPEMIENKYSDYQIQKMQDYIKQTEIMICDSFLKKGRLSIN